MSPAEYLAAPRTLHLHAIDAGAAVDAIKRTRQAHGSNNGCGTRHNLSEGAIVASAQKFAIVSAMVFPPYPSDGFPNKPTRA